MFFLDTADLQSLDRATQMVGVSISSAQARTGSYSYALVGTSAYIKYPIPETASGYVAVGMFTFSSTDQAIFIELDYNDDEQITVLFNTSAGRIDLKRGDYYGGTLIDYGGVISTYKWIYVEVQYTIDNSSGICNVKLDGEQVISFSGDTQALGVATVNNLTLRNRIGSTSYWDDIVICDDDWPGNGGNVVLVPDGNGTTASWTASSGNAWECVDEIPYSTADYIYADGSVSGTKHLFTYDNLSSTPDSIRAVGLCMPTATAEPGLGVVRPVMKYGSTTANGPAYYLSVTPKWVDYYRTTDPDSSAWTETSVNGLEGGPETQ